MSPPGEGKLISQCIGFCSRSRFNACYYSLSCFHPRHTAGPCSLCSLYRIPTSLKPGERSDPLAVCVRAKHHCSQTDTSYFTHTSYFTPCLLLDLSLLNVVSAARCLFYLVGIHREVRGQVQPQNSSPGTASNCCSVTHQQEGWLEHEPSNQQADRMKSSLSHSIMLSIVFSDILSHNFHVHGYFTNLLELCHFHDTSRMM